MFFPPKFVLVESKQKKMAILFKELKKAVFIDGRGRFDRIGNLNGHGDVYFDET